ncbi:MAG: PfkB family carbohydrate kinase [Candidatus Methylomirabilales bacterium]
MFDVCVIGHVTKDVIRTHDHVAREMPGGTAYYTSMALKGLGLDVAVVTKVAREDQTHLLNALKNAGIAVFCQESNQTTTFENIYLGENFDVRIQRVTAIASPFSPHDMPHIAAAIFHVGPLTDHDISLELLQHLARRDNRISLDVQGLVRRIKDGEVTERDWQEKETGLGEIDILKADENEARILSGENDVEKGATTIAGFGPQEIIITCGSRGSLILAEGGFHRIPPVPARTVVDPTGCGDTYMAGYMYQRLKSRDIDTAGKFGALVATANLERFGAFSGSEEELH